MSPVFESVTLNVKGNVLFFDQLQWHTHTCACTDTLKVLQQFNTVYNWIKLKVFIWLVVWFNSVTTFAFHWYSFLFFTFLVFFPYWYAFIWNSFFHLKSVVLVPYFHKYNLESCHQHFVMPVHEEHIYISLVVPNMQATLSTTLANHANIIFSTHQISH